jgi:hypothetical protein
MSTGNLLHTIAALSGLVALIIGTGALLMPEAMSRKFGITARGPALPYVMATGTRDVFMGLTILLLYFYEQWRLLGVVLCFVGIVAVADFLVVFKNGDKKTSAVHFLSAVFAVATGVWLAGISIS